MGAEEEDSGVERKRILERRVDVGAVGEKASLVDDLGVGEGIDILGDTGSITEASVESSYMGHYYI